MQCYIRKKEKGRKHDLRSFFFFSAGHRQIYESSLSLRHCVEGLCELALFVRGNVLMDDTVRGSLIDLLNSKQICALCSFLVTGLDGSMELLYNGTQLVVRHLVAKCFSLNDFNALFRGFDICQDIHLPC